jgi:hypothetical protein
LSKKTEIKDENLKFAYETEEVWKRIEKGKVIKLDLVILLKIDKMVTVIRDK